MLRISRLHYFAKTLHESPLLNANSLAFVTLLLSTLLYTSRDGVNTPFKAIAGKPYVLRQPAVLAGIESR